MHRPGCIDGREATNYNEAVLASERLMIERSDRVVLLADHTKLPPAITAELEKYGRAGVPMVLVYPKDASKPAVVLSEFPTPGAIVQALEDAAK